MRSVTSGSVVYSSRRKPVNADRDDLRITRSSTPAPTVHPIPGRPDAGRAALGALTDERLTVLARPDGNPAPGLLRQIDADAPQLRVPLEEVPGEHAPNASGSSTGCVAASA